MTNSVICPPRAAKHPIDIADPETCGEDLARNLMRMITLATDHCDGCADYHIVNSLKRLSGLMMWERGGRKPLVDVLQNLLSEKSERGTKQIDIMVAACADTAVLSTAARAAWCAGAIADNRARFTILDLCRTPLTLCEEYAARHDLSLETHVVDLLDASEEFRSDLIILHNFLPFVSVEKHEDLLRKLGRWLKNGGVIAIWNPVKKPDEREGSRSRVSNQIDTIKLMIDSGQIEIAEPRETLFARLDRMVDDPRPGEKRFVDVRALPDLMEQADLTVHTVEEVRIGTSRNNLYTIVVAGRPEDKP